MVKYKELRDIIVKCIDEQPDWNYSIASNSSIHFYKHTDSDIFTCSYSNYKTPGYILSARDYLFEFIIGKYTIDKIVKHKCFDAFSEYNSSLQEIYDLTHHLPHTLVPYDYSPFCLLKQPKETIQKLFDTALLIEEDIRKDMFNLQEKTLAFDIDHFDTIDSLAEDWITQLTKNKYTYEYIMRNKTTKGLSSPEILYKNTILKIDNEFELDLYVDSTNKFGINFTDRFGRDLFSAENSTIEQIKSYIPVCLNIMHKLSPKTSV